MRKIDKVDINKRKYKFLYDNKPSIIEVGKNYKRKIMDERGNKIVRDCYIIELLELDDGGLIIKSVTV